MPNSKKIVKNTLLLYVRMLFLMFIAFFTSRVVLDKLGIEDFGIQNVVGGLASMLTFFRSSLSNATQRFLTLALGRCDIQECKRIFSQHQSLYFLIALIIFVIAEVGGLWIIYNKLVIPSHRFIAAFWVFQFTLLSLFLTMLTIVYDSVLIAHEDMKAYSYLGIIEGLAKLGIAYAISIVPFDRLITYSFLMALVPLGILLYYISYCSKRYKEAHFKFLWDKTSVRVTFAFINWNVIGTAVWAINDQGINILLNMFFGPAVNAARGLAFQINQAVNHFSANFYTAVRPQIMKSYAADDKKYLFRLIYSSSKYSVFLLWYLSLPLMLRIDFVLSVWLKDIPEYTSVFTVWVLLYALVNSLSNPIWTLALSIGKLKWYILIGSGVFLMNFPISYVALRLGSSPTSVFIITFLVRSIYIVTILIIIRRYIDISFLDYFKEVILPSVGVISLSAILSLIVQNNIPNSMIGLIVVVILTTIIISLCIWIIGLKQVERNAVTKFLKKKLL